MKNGLVIDSYKTKRWYKEGLFHREDGPAIEYANGDKEWYKEGKLHRKNEPALEYINSIKKWYIEDKLHRDDGPAIECVDGYKVWYYEGEKIYCSSNKEFLQIIKMKAFW